MEQEFIEAYKKSNISWLIDMSFTRMRFGALNQQGYHYHMFEKWGSKYASYYVKNLQYDSERGNYRDVI